MKAKLYLLADGEPVDFWEIAPQSVFRIGRAPSNHARPKARGLSRNHAEMHCDLGQWSVHDLGSTNGTVVNGSRVEKEGIFLLRNGDTVATGSAEFLFELWEPRLPTCPICGEGEVFEEHVLVGDDLAREDIHVCVRCGTLLEELEDDDVFEFRFVPTLFGERCERLGAGPFGLEQLERLGEQAADELDALHEQQAAAAQSGVAAAATSVSPLEAEDERIQEEADEEVKALQDRVMAEIVAEAPRAPAAPEEREDVLQQQPEEAGTPSPVDEALAVAAEAQAAELTLDHTALEEEELQDYVPPAEAVPVPRIAADDLLSSVGTKRVERDDEDLVVAEVVGGEDDAGAAGSDAGPGDGSRPAERLGDPDWVKKARDQQRKHRGAELDLEEEVEREMEGAVTGDGEASRLRREMIKKALMAKKLGDRGRKGRRRKPQHVMFALAGIVPEAHRLVGAIIILLIAGGVAWGYRKLLEPGGPKHFMVRCKACRATFVHDGSEERAFNVKCKKCSEHRANVIFVCRHCGHVMWLNSAAEMDRKKCTICGSPRVQFAYPPRDGRPGTIEYIKQSVERRNREEGKGGPENEAPLPIDRGP